MSLTVSLKISSSRLRPFNIILFSRARFYITETVCGAVYMLYTYNVSLYIDIYILYIQRDHRKRIYNIMQSRQFL